MKCLYIILLILSYDVNSKKVPPKRKKCHPVGGCCTCGLRNQQEIDGDKACRDSGTLHTSSDDRIVGGCDAGGIIPWYVLFSLKIPNSLNSPKCGGVLINRLWVATAAHCFHGATYNLMDRDKDGAWQVQMNLSTSADIYIGIKKYLPQDFFNFMKSSPTNQIPFHIRELHLHHKYKRKSKDNSSQIRNDYDIALILLDYPVAGNENKESEKIGRYLRFHRSTAMPICLPYKTYKDTERQVMSAGMGIINNKQEDCYTNEKGPDIFTKCTRKFRYYTDNVTDEFGEWEYGIETSAAMPCVMYESTIPSFKLDPFCEKFRRTHKKSVLKKINDGKYLTEEDIRLLNFTDPEAILISKKTVSHCFHTKFAQNSYGWCGTCLSNATKNTPGYCEDGKDPTIEEFGVVYSDRGWGFCDISCSIGYNIFTSTVKKIKLTTFSDKLCEKAGVRLNATQQMKKDHGNPFVVNIRNELCGGYINRVNATTFLYNEQNDEFKLIEDTKKVNDYNSKSDINLRSVRLENNPYLPNKENGFVIGGEDTCAGDSGGPLYAMDPEGDHIDKLDQVSTLVGLVSRGSGCALKNYPGIYTRVKKHLAWIFKIMTNSGVKGRQVYRRKNEKHDAFTWGGEKEGKLIIVDPFCRKETKLELERRRKRKKRNSRKRKKRKKRRKRRKRKRRKRKKRRDRKYGHRFLSPNLELF